MITLKNGHLEAGLWPEAGGRISYLRHALAGDILIPLDHRDFDPEAWPKAGGYPLMPFHNRVKEGRFNWSGRTINLPLHPSEPNALHGFSSRRQWIGIQRDESIATMQIDHAGDEAWPWAMSASQEIRLEKNSITLTLSVSNRDRETMPAGLGWHPFMPTPLFIEHDAENEWPMAADYLPTGARLPRTKKTDQLPTRFVSAWSRVEVTLASGGRLTITADPVFSHLVIHEARAGYVCIEPAPHLANALASPPIAARDGMRSLAPGESLTGTIVFTLGD